MTKIFCDIADKRLIKKFNKKRIVKGFTTNPSLMRKAGAKDYKSYSYEILKLSLLGDFLTDNKKELNKCIAQDGTKHGPGNSTDANCYGPDGGGRHRCRTR